MTEYQSLMLSVLTGAWQTVKGIRAKMAEERPAMVRYPLHQLEQELKALQKATPGMARYQRRRQNGTVDANLFRLLSQKELEQVERRGVSQ